MRKNTSSPLTDEEQKWMQLFYRIEFPWKEQIQKQISASSVAREYYPDALFLWFNVPPEMQTLPRFSHRIPIEILVQHICVEEAVMGTISVDNIRSQPMLRLGENGPEPTAFLLHVVDGAVRELEIFNWDQAKIDRREICKGRCDYWISPDFAGIFTC